MSGEEKDQMQGKRITNSSLSEMTALFFEQGDRRGCFHTIPHLPLGYGSNGCNDTEAECYETISFFIKAARDEGSKVFILGFAPRVVPVLWIKTAELIIEGSEVKTVLIPIAKKVNDDDRSSTICGSLLYVTEGGISNTKSMGQLDVEDFWIQVTEIAMSLNVVAT